MDNRWDAKWVYFSIAGTSQSGKTQLWYVMARQGDLYLGQIRWHSPWRKYAFYPDPHNQTVYESDCLRDIADFIEVQTDVHRESRGSLDPKPQTTYGLLAGRDLSK